ncbi:MAG TPA: ATP-binding protein, partial [Aquabacterium sp.]|nr:ATP-binding protein [Aquabacterium sp.]
PSDALSVHQKVLDWANRLDRDGAPASDEVESPDLAASQPLSPAAQQPHTTQATKPDELPADEEDTESYLRVPASLIDSLLKLAGENSILTSQIQDRVQRVSHNLHAMRGGARQFGQLSSELEQLVDVRGLAMVGGDAQDGLDALEMDQYNELHMLSRRILESSADSRELTRSFEQDLTVLRDLMAEKERMQLEIQRAIQRARMVDVASVVPRLQRTVRQAARLLGRQVQLHLQGADTLVDTQLLDRIIDPLMHLLRNAVDHGIEPADMRQAQGKDSTGCITLTFRSVGNGIAVRCEDDGAGLDLSAIRHRGVGMGLLSKDTQADDAQVMRLILHPGFSTRTQTTQLSGRGIGMDVVYRTVLDLRGTLEMDTHAGQGTCFDLLFPVRMSTVQVMLTHSDRHMLAISVRGVEQILP